VALDCDGHGPKDPVANLLMTIFMVFTVREEDTTRLEKPDAVNAFRRKYEDMLERYLRHQYGSEVAREKLSAIESGERFLHFSQTMRVEYV